MIRGIRGATTVTHDHDQLIWEATDELMSALIKENDIVAEDVASAVVTVSPDLKSAFPAKSIRTLPGWDMVPVMCSVEIDVPGALERCIRVLLLVNTNRDQRSIRHIYLREAVRLRPDLVIAPDNNAKILSEG